MISEEDFILSNLEWSPVDRILISSYSAPIFKNESQSIRFMSMSNFSALSHCSKKRLMRIEKEKECYFSSEEDQQIENNMADSLSAIFFEYNEQNLIQKIFNKKGNFLHLLYDENHKISKISNESGNVLYDRSIVRTGSSDIFFDSKSIETEEQIDKIELYFASNISLQCHVISYYRNAQNEWKFGYRREMSFTAFK
jgi:hypothetical protein